MDFDFTPEQQRFRAEARAWLAENVPADLKGRGFAASRADREEVDRLREWQRTIHKAGYVGLDWPAEYGGRGVSIMEQIILYEEMSRAEAPQPVNRGGISMLGPTLMRHGTPAQKARHLGKILTAEEIWCQGFSEPNAGSDLANLQTRAVLDGDWYVINGQKVWTSMAHVSDWGFFLVRTDPNAAKHKGITFILVDMKTPGITHPAAPADHGRGRVQRGLPRERARAGRQRRRQGQRGVGRGDHDARPRAGRADHDPPHQPAHRARAADRARRSGRSGTASRRPRIPCCGRRSRASRSPSGASSSTATGA